MRSAAVVDAKIWRREGGRLYEYHCSMLSTLYPNIICPVYAVVVSHASRLSSRSPIAAHRSPQAKQLLSEY